MRAARLLATLAAVLLAAATAGVLERGTSAAQAPETPVTAIRVLVDPPEPRIGDLVRVIVTVTYSSDLLVTASRFVPAQGIDLVEALPPVTELLETAAVTEFVLVLQPFVLGQTAARELSVTALDIEGRTSEFTVTVPPLTVRSTVTAGDLELRPLKPQLSIDGAPPLWQSTAAVVTLVGAAAVAAGGGLLVWRRRRRSAGDIDAIEAPDTSAEASARRRLDGVAAASLLDDEEFERYYGELSHTVRSYLEQRFGFRATALTTTELERRMRRRGLDRWQARLVGGLLERCDAAVYARDRPDVASADHDLTVAYEIVELSRPGPVVAVEA